MSSWRLVRQFSMHNASCYVHHTTAKRHFSDGADAEKHSDDGSACDAATVTSPNERCSGESNTVWDAASYHIQTVQMCHIKSVCDEICSNTDWCAFSFLQEYAPSNDCFSGSLDNVEGCRGSLSQWFYSILTHSLPSSSTPGCTA